MAALSTVLSLGFGSLRRPWRLSFFSSFNSLRQQQISLLRCQSLVLSRSPLNRALQASLQSNYAPVTSPGDHSEIVFMGTGTSEGIPRVSCLTNPLKTCSVCTKSNRTWKQEQETLTPAFLFGTLDHPEQSNILIGCGKLRTLDAVVITHSHADAIGGPDDLRDWTNNVQPHIPIYTATRDFEKHQEFFEPFVITRNALDQITETFEQYCKRMKKEPSYWEESRSW